MWHLVKQLLRFKMGQKTSKSAARMLGFRKLGLLIGLIGGWRAMRRHRHA